MGDAQPGEPCPHQTRMSLVVVSHYLTIRPVACCCSGVDSEWAIPHSGDPNYRIGIEQASPDQIHFMCLGQSGLPGPLVSFITSSIR